LNLEVETNGFGVTFPKKVTRKHQYFHNVHSFTSTDEPGVISYKACMYVVCLKRTVNGTRKQTIQERVTELLRSIPKEAFADSFQKLNERYE
jgi:chorismate mutase